MHLVPAVPPKGWPVLGIGETGTHAWGPGRGTAQRVWTHRLVPLSAKALSLGRTVTLTPWPPPRAPWLQTSQSGLPGHLVPTSPAGPSRPHPVLAPTRQMSRPLRPWVVSLGHPCLGHSAFSPVLSLPSPAGPSSPSRSSAEEHAWPPVCSGPGSCTSGEQTPGPATLPFSVHYLHSGSHPPPLIQAPAARCAPWMPIE